MSILGSETPVLNNGRCKSILEAWGIEDEVNLRELDCFASAVHDNSVEHGWWVGGKNNDAECVALMHSELSEALEAMRNGNPPSEKIPEFSHVEEELADCIIRILDFCEAKDFNLPGAMFAKAKYNETRPYKHGGKLF